MTLEEMQQTWQTETTRLNHAIRLFENRLMWDRIQRLKTPIRRVMVALGFEIFVAVCFLIILNSFLATHWRKPQFFLPAAMVHLWCLGTLISSVRQIALAAHINYDEPIATVQTRINELRKQRLTAFRWKFLTGQIVWWIPFTVTALKLVFDVDAYRVLSPAFLAVNLLAGLLAIPILMYAAKSLSATRADGVIQRLADIIAGRSLSEARKQAQDLADLVTPPNEVVTPCV